MKEIELYINQKLCDIGNTKDFSVYLKRQFLNPSELSAKDAQRSYDITLPASPTNNAIFGHINTEEVRDKFTTLYDAVLILGSIKIFEGKFKISEITHKEYKGNLGIPYTKSIKEIFEDKKMNEVGEWLVPFTDSSSISAMNRKDNPECFFPLTLYGLLPKVPEKKVEKRDLYSGKNQIDETIRIGFDDLPASINCLEAVRKLFKSQGYNINGSAFTDERLKRIYMSYRNPAGHQMGWPYGTLAKIGLKGSWTNALINTNLYANEPCLFEINVTKSTSSDYNQDSYTCDLLNSSNLNMSSSDIDDAGANMTSHTTKIKYKINKNTKGEVDREYKNNTIIIPASGYYKVSLSGDLYIPNAGDIKFVDTVPQISVKEMGRFNTQDQNNDNLYILSAFNTTSISAFLDTHRYELKLLRDRGTRDFGLENTSIDGTFFKNNLQQNPEDLKTEINDEKINPVYYPYIDRSNATVNNEAKYKPCQTMFVDPAQNSNLVVGLSWGTWKNATPPFDQKEHNNNDRLKNSVWAQALVSKSCHSWDYDSKDKPLSFAAVNAPHGYMVYSPTEIPEDKSDIKQVTRASEPDPNDFYETGKYKVILKNSPLNHARRGFSQIDTISRLGELENHMSTTPNVTKPNIQYGDGIVNAIVWFDKGERITLVSSSDRCVYKGKRELYGWGWHYLNFKLDITPFRTDKPWVKIDEYSGTGYQEMDWKDEPKDKKNQFLRNNIDLIKFLPSSQKVDEWLENFCKAFNLDVTRIDKKNFELNTKRTLNQQVSRIIDLDQKANVTINRQNNSFELPSVYEIGFTSDKDEQGYQESMMDAEGNLIENKGGDDGGGRFTTSSVEDKKMSQTSNFSYNWMKKMEQRKPIKKPNGTMETEADIYYKTASFPIISDKEPWNMMDNSDYAEMMQKDYIDKTQRFWYKSKERYSAKINNKYEIVAGLVSNTYDGVQPMTLNYKNRENSILRNYFTLLTDAGNCFTTVDCYLTPEEYNNLGNSMVKFNGDMYFVAEVDGYDPLERKKATLKLVRKML